MCQSILNIELRKSSNFIFNSIWTQAELYRKLELRTDEPEKLNKFHAK
jgi:hypothetical protein